MKNEKINPIDNYCQFDDKAMERLLEKYYEGETSCQEDKLIKVWLNSKKGVKEESFKEDIAVNSFLQLYLRDNVKQNSSSAAINIKRYVRDSIAVAAALILAVGGYFRFQSDEIYVTYVNGEKIKNSELALHNMKRTMSEISESDNIENQLSDIFSGLEYKN